MEYVIGRRGSLDYLDKDVRAELVDHSDEAVPISGRTLRPKVEKSFEVAENIIAVGSLAGDSLIRFAYGGCLLAAKIILERKDSLTLL